MSMQKLITEELRKFAEELGCTLVINYNYSNTGKAWFMKGLTKKVGFYFDFQTDTMSLQFYPGDKEVVGTCGFTHQNCFSNVYVNYGRDDLEGTMSVIKSKLKYRIIEPKTTVKKPRKKTTV